MVDSISGENVQIDADAIPSVIDITFEGLSENFPKMLFLLSIVAWLALFTIVLGVKFLSGDLSWLLGQWWLYILFIAPIGVFYWFSGALARSKSYALRELDIHYRSGLIWQKIISLPYNRIQHVEVESGPVERYFKMVSLKIFTAGGSRADMSIPGLTPALASKIRAYLIEQGDLGEAA